MAMNILKIKIRVSIFCYLHSITIDIKKLYLKNAIFSYMEKMKKFPLYI